MNSAFCVSPDGSIGGSIIGETRDLTKEIAQFDPCARGIRDVAWRISFYLERCKPGWQPQRHQQPRTLPPVHRRAVLLGWERYGRPVL